MVENLERIVKEPAQNQSDKLFATQAIKLVIEQSIVLGIRTSEDWSKYSHLRDVPRKLIGNNLGANTKSKNG